MIYNNLYQEDETSAISEIQRYLRNISYLHPELPRIALSEKYDSQTKTAVEEFQKFSGIPVTGIVDYSTWNAIVRENDLHIKSKEMPYKLPCRSIDFGNIKIGYSGDIVYALKIMLNNFCRKYKNYKHLEINDKYDYETEVAVKEFQKISMLPVTGIVDKETWNTMISIYSTCKLYDHK
jgi:peptidoglycan hydrolase-like protein with peptidoglycan-binding domain